MTGSYLRHGTRTWLFLVLTTFAILGRAEETNNSGLILTLKSAAGTTDSTMVPTIALFVAKGEAPSPFVDPGKFTAVWEGQLNAELRSDFSFQAELNGQLKLEINGATVYEARNSSTPLSKPIQLNKGPNAVRATYVSPDQGDAFVRLSWTEKPPFTSPIPSAVLSHGPGSALSDRIHLGRELFLEHRCANCHKTDGSIPELKMDAPSFEGIGARRNFEWMARWILDPRSTRAKVHMPKVLSGPTAKEDAEAMAAYLSSLKTGGEVTIPEPKIKTRPSNLAENDNPPEPGQDVKPLFERLHCAACHNTPEEKQPGKIGLEHVAQKFTPGKLAEFLRAPEAHFAWIRMPNFHLTSKEANELAEYLLGKAEKPAGKEVTLDKAALERGQKLVQESGCLNCHNSKIENKFSTPALATLKADNWSRGCLAAERKIGNKAPDFGFNESEREALQAFGKTDRRSLARHVPAEFAERQTRLANCLACHGQPEGFPPLEILGGKLKPEWAAKFIAGEVSYKPRAEKHPKGEPWLEMRMPAFKSRAGFLAPGLAAQHGYPPQSSSEPPINNELAKIGQKLVGKDGGFSCISCHGAGKLEAMEVFESEGINLAYSSERLLPAYYRRWVRNPLSIDPQTKMPVYFDEGKSPLTEVLAGDAEKQLDAIWEYIRLGSSMPSPATGAQ